MGIEPRAERKTVLLIAAVMVIAASLPYLWALLIVSNGFSFLGFTHNIDDGAVYLSWVNQIARGSLTYTNLYTPEAHAAQFNLLFLLMGWTAAISWLPSGVVFHLFRVLLAFGVVLYAWKFCRQFFDDARQRILFIALLCFSSGLGWLVKGGAIPNAPVDTWQPEAITFLSVYLNPLFLAGLLLMLIAFDNLLTMVRTGKARYAAYAGIALLILGNVHTYDVVTVGAVWLMYLVGMGMRYDRFPATEIWLSLITALVASPSLLYQVYVFKTDPAFAARVNSPAPSPDFQYYFVGYGLILVGVLVGIVRWERLRPRNADPWLLMIYAWAVMGFIVPFLPVAQQRKLVMGLHIPLCILAAYGLAPLLARLKTQTFAIAVCAIAILTSISNWAFIANDSRLLENGRTVTHYPPFARSAEFSAMQQIRHIAQPSDTIYATPELALWTPVYTRYRVYYGHWSETPDYAKKLGRFLEFAAGSTRATTRDSILVETGADYLIYDSNRYPLSVSLKTYLQTHLTRVWEDGGIAIYRVNSGQSTVDSRVR